MDYLTSLHSIIMAPAFYAFIHTSLASLICDLRLCAPEVHSSFLASYSCSRAARVIRWLRPLAWSQLCYAWLPAFHSEGLHCYGKQRWAIGLADSYWRHDVVIGPRIFEMSCSTLWVWAPFCFWCTSSTQRRLLPLCSLSLTTLGAWGERPLSCGYVPRVADTLALFCHALRSISRSRIFNSLLVDKIAIWLVIWWCY